MALRNVCCASVMLLVLSTGSRAQSDAGGGQGVGVARETIGKWIQTQKLIYQERKDWQQQKEVLRSRIELIGKEIQELETKLAETRRAASVAAGKRTDADATKRGLVGESAHLSSQLEEFETAIRRIHVLLPTPVQEKVQPLFTRVPEDPKGTKVSVAERFQNVLGIMNEVNRANSEIVLTTEVRTLQGKPTEVKVVYLGLAQAYYLSARGEAGLGRPTPEGWAWTPENALAQRILEVVEILEGKAQPRFVPLPVKIS